jgi:hypothetical protein
MRRSLPLDAVRWPLVAVVINTAVMRLRSARQGARAARPRAVV